MAPAMRIFVALLLLAASLAVAPNAAAEFCDGDPSAAVEVCKDTGTVEGDVHDKQVTTSGCLIDIDGTCVPREVSVSDGTVVGGYVLPSVYVGVYSNEVCFTLLPPPQMPDPPVPTGVAFNGCGGSFDSAPLTAYVVDLLL